MANTTKTSKTEWEISQLVRTRLFPDEDAVLRSALRALFQAQPEVRRQMVIRAYPPQQTPTSGAAETSS